MKSLILIGAIFIQGHAFSSEGKGIKSWDIIEGDQGYYLYQPKSEDKIINIQTIGGKPSLKEIIHKKEAPGYDFIIYDAGRAGTQDIVTSYRAVIFDRKKESFVGNVPYKYESQLGKKLIQPTWTFESGKLNVEDKNSGSMKVIPLP